MTERQRERELVLAPNEFAWVLDTTKGHINCYVGPNKTSLAQTDQPVVFNPATKRFDHVDLSLAVQLFPTAPSNWYMVLKNPARNGTRPNAGVANSMMELEVGRKVVIKGPDTFPLWPGQMARVIEGHRLESKQYLVVRIYDAARARAGWNAALGRPDDDASPSFVAGESVVIRGTDVSFFIPPDGAEVVPDGAGRYVRDAVTLNALEYCVLDADDGTRKYVRGEAVVFPEAGETFLERGGKRKFRALELSGTTGLHVKVVAPYVDEDGEHAEGEELFITGENRIYFPRPEHVVVRYGDQKSEVHHAVAIPRGEGRYVLDRTSGEVTSVTGPRMFLPDPRREVIVRRVLTERECELMYPGNEAVRRANSARRDDSPAQAAPTRTAPGRRPSGSDEVESIERDWSPPRTLTLDAKFDGVVTVDVWPGYAVQVVDRSGARRVEVGPTTLMLAYDETLAPLALSTGTPKTADHRLSTAFLQVRGNKVSDAFGVMSADMVECWVTVAYRVEFTGDDPGQWFDVDDYVKLLCDHARSIVAHAARSIGVRQLFGSIADVVRDAVLGAAGKGGERAGRVFSENAMRVHDVEVLEFCVLDDDVAEVLEDAQRETISRAVEVSRAAREATDREQLEAAVRAQIATSHETERLRLQLAEQVAELQHHNRRREAELAAELSALRRGAELVAAKEMTAVIEQAAAGRRIEHEADVARRSDLLDLQTRELEARVAAHVAHAQAFSPHLVEALRRLGDEQLLGKLSDNFAELAAVEGRGLLETARKFLDFVPASRLPVLGDAE